MDFEKLLEPYSENGRTVPLQIKWLMKKGIDQHSIDYAMSAVYKEIEAGKTFADGHELDHELLRVAQQYQNREIDEQFKKRIGSIEANLDVEWNRLTKWQKIKQVLQGKA